MGISVSDFKRPVSIPSQRPRFSVAGNPFNGVKIGLVMILLGGAPLWLTVDILVQAPAAQLALLGGYGLAGMGWVVIRTRHILRNRPHGED